MNNDQPNAFSLRQFAKRNNLGITKIYELINTGRLVARKVDKRTLIFLEDELAWKQSLARLVPGPFDTKA
jgi:hypothetical protein